MSSEQQIDQFFQSPAHRDDRNLMTDMREKNRRGGRDTASLRFAECRASDSKEQRDRCVKSEPGLAWGWRTAVVEKHNTTLARREPV
jgi:hypothetical protein